MSDSRWSLETDFQFVPEASSADNPRQHNENVATSYADNPRQQNETSVSSSAGSPRQHNETLVISSADSSRQHNETSVTSSANIPRQHNETLATSSADSSRQHNETSVTSSANIPRQHNETLATSSADSSRQHNETSVTSSANILRQHNETLATSSADSSRQHNETSVTSSANILRQHNETSVTSSVNILRQHNETLVTSSTDNLRQNNETLVTSSADSPRQHNETSITSSADSPKQHNKILVTSSANNRKQHNEALINCMPDLVIHKIFQFLYWKEKLFAVDVFPHWEHVLNSCLGWERFENDRGYAHRCESLMSSHYVLEEVACIAQYGQYFSHCIIWIHNFLPTDSPVDTDFSILKYVELHCPKLKSLSIYHPPNLSSTALTLSYVQYVLPLQNILNSEKHVRLNLYRLLYSSVEAGTGVPELLHFYQCHNLLRKVTSLDFSHGLIPVSSVQPLNIMMICTALRILKCPIQNLTTTIIQQLLNRNLQELYVVNDEHTLNLNYSERSSIKWTMLKPKENCQFKVHYIYRNRAVCPVHICPNPYIKSLVLDSLCSSVSRALLRSIADTYSRSLECLAFILSVWEPLVPFSDLEDLANNFKYLATRLIQLHTALLNLIIPSDVLITFAHHSPKLTELLVYEHKIFFNGKTAITEDQLLDLKQEVSGALRQPWSPVPSAETIYRLNCCQQNLLFEENVNQWEGFW